MGSERLWKWEMRDLTWGRQVVVMGTKKFCISIIKRAVVILEVAASSLLGTMSKSGLLIDEETFGSFGTCLCNDVALEGVR